jgi:hypothetical protein
MPAEQIRRLEVAEAESSPAGRPGGAAFLERVQALKQRHGGGVEDFTPARFDFVPAEPFPVYDPFSDTQIL